MLVAALNSVRGVEWNKLLATVAHGTYNALVQSALTPRVPGEGANTCFVVRVGVCAISSLAY
jgi:hypothetical protein